MSAADPLLDDLFEHIPPLAALRGHERDKVREEMRRLIEPELWVDGDDDDDDDDDE